MLKHLVLSVLVLAGCTSKSGQPTTIRWQLPKGESLAYKVTAEGGAVVDGEDKGKQDFSGYIYVDVDGEGSANIRLETGQPIFGMTSMALKADASNFFFPLPEAPIAGKPLGQKMTIKGLGNTANQTNPDIEVSETLTKTAADGSSASLNFSRKGKAAGATPLSLELEEDGKGTFDLQAGRYQRLERTTKMTMSGDLGGDSTNMAVTVKFTLEFDAERSKTRTKERAQLREPPVSADELAKYLKANPVESEISNAVRKLSNHGMPTAFLFFHLRANPVATWQQAMALPSEEREAFVSGVSFHVGRGQRLPQALVDWFKAELPKQPALEDAVANMQDARLREQLVPLAALSGPDKEMIARRAGDSLKAIDAQEAGPKALLTADERQFMEIGHALQAEGQDYRALVPILIEVLEKAASSSSTSKMPLDDLCVQWLEGLVSRSFRKDVKAWKAFWEANKHKPYCQWMVEAAGQDTPLLVNNALSKLSTCRESREATDYLASRAQKDTGDTRHLAALSLAEHNDKRAIPVLIDMLAGDNQQLRAMALVALANFHNTTLGYDPEGDDASRAAALRRWRAWAKEPPAPTK
ncbi:MAG: HEAT repeat domain-containing protein [Myxococcales bacterium]|nr:HEAT repeat domain-containing protein [Myxococcales bacterium]